MLLSLTSSLFFLLWCHYILSLCRGKLLEYKQVIALRMPLFILHTLCYMALMALLPLETLVPHIEGFEISYIPPFSLINIQQLSSIRSSSPMSPYLAFFCLGGLLIWGSFYLINRKPLARTIIIEHASHHLLFSLALLLSQRYYLFGTDKLGNDLFLQVCFALKTGLCFALLAMSISLVIGVIVGLLSGYSRGKIAYAFDYFYNVINAIPSILLLILALYFVRSSLETYQNLTASLYQEISMISLALCLSLTQWVPLCRLVRAQVLVLRQAEFIQALELMHTPMRIIFLKHLLPHLYGLIALTVIFDISQYLLAEALLTFIGLGFQGDVVSFGMIINENRYAFLNTPIYWWPLFAVFITLTPLVLSLNIIADYLENHAMTTQGLRDVRNA